MKLLNFFIILCILSCTYFQLPAANLGGIPCMDPVIETDSVNASCPSSCDGKAIVNVVGALVPYEYEWDASTGSQTTSIATGLCAATYMVTVTETFNSLCFYIHSVTVNSTPDNTPPTCLAKNIGITIASNGTAMASAAAVNNNSSDNCGGIILSLDRDSFTCSDLPSYYATLTVQDQSGNTTTCNATINIADKLGYCPSCTTPNVSVLQTKPSCPGGNDGYATAVVAGASTYSYVWNDAWSQTTSTATGLSAGTYAVTVTDLSVSNCSAVAIEVLKNGTDSTAPIISIPPDTMINCNGDTSINSTGFASADDNCDSLPKISRIDSVIGDSVICRIWTATDLSGNVSIDTQKIILKPCPVDCEVSVWGQWSECTGGIRIRTRSVIVPPMFGGDLCPELADTQSCGIDSSSNEIDCPDDLTVSTETGNCYANISGLIATAFDSSLIDTIMHNSTVSSGGADASGQYPVGVTIVRFIAIDTSGNSDTCYTTVTVQDTLDPVALCRNLTVYLDSNGNAAITAEMVDSGSYDNCGIVDLSLDTTAFDCSAKGVKYVILTVTDTFSNTSTCISGITIIDTLQPHAICKLSTAYINDSGIAVIDPYTVASLSYDNCNIEIFAYPDTFNCSQTGNQNVTIVVQDDNGNSSSCIAIVDVQDNLPPTIICIDHCVYLDSSGKASFNAYELHQLFEDNCTIDTLIANEAKVSCSDVSYLQMLNSDQLTGNQAWTGPLATDFKVLDPSGVFITQMGAFDHNSDGIYGSINGNSIRVAIYDLNDSTIIAGTDVLISGSNDTLINNFRMKDISPVLLPPGYYTVIAQGYNSSEENGNANKGSYPLLTFNELPGILVGEGVSRWGGAGASFTDLDQSIAHNGFFHAGNFTFKGTFINVEVLAYDNAGNSDSCTSKVIIKDTIPLKITCPANITTVNDSGLCSAIVYFDDATATDNCLMDIFQIRGGSSGSSFPVDTYSIAFVAVDSCGKTDSCSFTIEVKDTEAPVLSCIDTAIVYADSACNASYTDTLDFYDNCDGAYLLEIIVSSTGSGMIEIPLHANDMAGNVDSSCYLTYIVRDTIKPSISCPVSPVYFEAADSCGLVIDSADLNLPVAWDNCIVFVNQMGGIAPGSFFPVGPTIMTYEALDLDGNSSSCSFTVEVTDTSSPKAICQDLTVYLDSNGFAEVTVNDIDSGSMDNCDLILSFSDDSLRTSISFSCNSASMADYPLGESNVILYVSDPSGNRDSCNALITALDTIHPVILCKDSIVYLDTNGSAGPVSLSGLYDAFDACSFFAPLDSTVYFDCDDTAKMFTFGFTVFDIAGNISSCNAKITVVDTISPVAICKDSVKVYIDSLVKLPPSFFNNGSYANCSSVSLSTDQFLFNCSDIGYNDVTLTVTDMNGLSSDCISVLEIRDLIKPVAKCKSPVIAYRDVEGDVYPSSSLMDDGSYDNCGETLSYSFNPSVLHCSSNFVTMTVTDQSGKSSSCGASIITYDTTAPSVICSDVKVDLQPSGIQIISIEDALVSATDGCGIKDTAISQNIFSCSDLGVNIETITVTDKAGNKTVCSFEVTVNDPSGTCTPACPSPENLLTYDISYSSVSGKWSPVPNAMSYIVQGNRVGGAPVGFSTTDTFYSLQGLRHATLYRWNVVAVCSGNVSSAPSTQIFFSTDTCEKPVNLRVDNISSESATLRWDIFSEAIAYKVKGGPAGGTFNTILVNGGHVDSLSVSELIPDQEYVWSLISICDNNPLVVSARSELDTFNTLAGIPKQHSLFESDDRNRISIYPNPSGGKFFVEINEPAAEVSIVVLDFLGKEVWMQEFINIKEKTSIPVMMKDEDKGTYIVKVIMDSKQYFRKIVLR